MANAADVLDELTQMFSVDRAYCDALLCSANADLVAELLIAHQWANASMPACTEGLNDAAVAHFGSDAELGQFWSLLFLDSISRDLRLVPYFVLHGLNSEASGVLRRTLEHIGVLAHIWAEPKKVLALKESDSKEYTNAFRREVDAGKAKALRDSLGSKRFAAMRMGGVATILYGALSEMDVHGGTGSTFFSKATTEGELRCSFLVRPDVSADQTRLRIRILTDGHRSVCAELMALCSNYAQRSDELRLAAERFKLLASTAGEPSAELQQHVTTLLERLGVAGHHDAH